MPDLTDLLARWHDTAPDECQYVAAEPGRGTHARYRFSIFDRLVGGGSDEDRETWHRAISANHDAALIHGAVVYHAERRGYESFHNVKDYGEGQKQVVFLIQNPAGLKKASVGTIAYPRHDGAAALRALAMSALSAYLDAISDA